jgi:hypothetical protein
LGRRRGLLGELLLRLLHLRGVGLLSAEAVRAGLRVLLRRPRLSGQALLLRRGSRGVHSLLSELRRLVVSLLYRVLTLRDRRRVGLRGLREGVRRLLRLRLGVLRGGLLEIR